MSMFRFFLLGIITVGLFSSVNVFAGAGHDKAAISQIAEIMHRLKHYPSPAGKEQLNKIKQASGTTANERTIATAMINLEHSVSAGDVSKLKAVVGDKKATANERDIASIILSLDHRPSSQDKAKLKAMMH